MLRRQWLVLRGGVGSVCSCGVAAAATAARGPAGVDGRTCNNGSTVLVYVQLYCRQYYYSTTCTTYKAWQFGGARKRAAILQKPCAVPTAVVGKKQQE